MPLLSRMLLGPLEVDIRRGAVDGVSADPAAAAETLRRIADLAASEDLVYLPTHDPESARRLASRTPVPRS